MDVGPGLGLALVGCWVWGCVGERVFGIRGLERLALSWGRGWHWWMFGCCARIVVRCIWLMDVGPGLGLALVGCWV